MSRAHGIDPERFRVLPEAVALENTITSQDTVVVESADDELREVNWVLRSAG